MRENLIHEKIATKLKEIKPDSIGLTELANYVGIQSIELDRILIREKYYVSRDRYKRRAFVMLNTLESKKFHLRKNLFGMLKKHLPNHLMTISELNGLVDDILKSLIPDSRIEKINNTNPDPMDTVKFNQDLLRFANKLLKERSRRKSTKPSFKR